MTLRSGKREIASELWYDRQRFQ
jgi:hypothetical protein